MDEEKKKNRLGFVAGGCEYWFEPDPGVTAYELALCVDVLLRATMAVFGAQAALAAYRKLPPGAARHFQTRPLPPAPEEENRPWWRRWLPPWSE